MISNNEIEKKKATKKYWSALIFQTCDMGYWITSIMHGKTTKVDPWQVKYRMMKSKKKIIAYDDLKLKKIVEQ